MSNTFGYPDGLAVVEDLCGLAPVRACLEPGERHPGPCPGARPGLLRKLLTRRARPKKSAKAPAPVGHQRARGRDILAELDMDTIGRLPKREGGTGKWRSGQHDAQLGAIAHRQGFGGAPNVVDQAGFDRLKAQRGAVPLFRGSEDNEGAGKSGEEIAALFRTGPIWYGQGWAGNGIYAASDRDGALKYTTGDRPGSLNEMVLDPGARVAYARDLAREMDAEMPPDTRERLAAVAAVQQLLFEPGKRSAEMVTTAQAMKGRLQPQDWLWMDPHAYAMAKGYDAVYHGKEARFPAGEWVLLNRTAVHTLDPQRAPRTLAELYPGREMVAASARVHACKPPYVPRAQPGVCPKIRPRLRNLRRKAAAHPKRQTPQGAAQPGGYTGPRFPLSPGLAARWDTALGQAVKARTFGNDVTISDQEREGARDAVEAFKAGLTAPQLRRFEQEQSIALAHDEWRRRVPEGQRDTPARAQARMRAALRDLWSGKKIAIRATPQDLEQVLDDGRYKTVHETGRTGGFNNPQSREDLEEQLFGIDPQTAPVEQRPVYGYVAVNGIRRAGLDAALGQYGSVQVVLKDAVRRRTTASNADSMGKRSSVRPSPVDQPQHWSFQAAGQPPGQYEVDGQRLAGNGYAEAQIHGGVTLDDIEEAVFGREPDEGLRAKLEEKGIPWRVVN